MYLQNGIYNEWTRQYTIDISVIANMKYVFFQFWQVILVCLKLYIVVRNQSKQLSLGEI